MTDNVVPSTELPATSSGNTSCGPPITPVNRESRHRESATPSSSMTATELSQDELDRMILDHLVMNRMSFRSLDSPSWVTFLRRVCPGKKITSRLVMKRKMDSIVSKEVITNILLHNIVHTNITGGKQMYVVISCN